MTHPDKDSKEIDLQAAPSEDVSIAADARQKTGRTVSAPDAPRANAAFERWNAERGFGFLTMEDGRRAFCHVSELCSHLNPGRGNEPDLNAKIHVDQVIEGDKGFKAKKVQCMDCITPAVWELQPDGPELWGVREMKLVCIGKPNEPSYKSPIPFNQVYEANEPFRKAQEKERRWQWDINAAFFEEFGEPEKTEVTSDNLLILMYPHGQKTVSAYAVLESGHWKFTASGQWEKGKSDVSAEFISESLQGLSIMRQVGHASHPTSLSKDFDLLPPDIQAEMLEHLRAIIPTAKGLAEERWAEFSNTDYEQEKISKLRDDLIKLQAPGEMYHDSRSYSSQEEITGHYGDETWGTGRYMDVHRTYWYLVTGARKSEKKGYGIHNSQYTGGNKFVIPTPKEGQTTEQLHGELLAKKLEELGGVFGRVREITNIPDEPRLYDIQPEAWSTQYKDCIDQLEQNLREKWNTEDQTALNKLNKEWEEYNQLVNDLELAQKELSEVSKRASKLAVSLYDSGEPIMKEIGVATLEELQQYIVDLKAYIPKAEAMIAAELQARKERDKESDDARQARIEALQKATNQQPSVVDEAGPSKRQTREMEREVAAKKVGEALANQAEAVLGAQQAISLIDGELNANYGRARRQQAVSNALGKPADDSVANFFAYGRATEVDTALSTALEYLREHGAQQVPTAAKSPAKPPAYADVPATPEPAKPANMADLMGRFGKRK